MHVADTEQVQLDFYQLKDVSRTLFDQLKESRDKNAQPVSQAYFEEAFSKCFLPQ